MRRAVLVCVVGATAALAASPNGLAAGCRPTASDSGGPDRSPPLRATIGKGHVLTGVVLSPACTPVAGARISFWQSNRDGVYTAAGAGAVITTKSGRFRFQGPRPTSGSGFPGHIHIKVQAAGYETLFTEYFPPPSSARGSVRLVLTPAAL